MIFGFTIGQHIGNHVFPVSDLMCKSRCGTRWQKAMTMSNQQHSEDEIRQAFCKHVPEILSGALQIKKMVTAPGQGAYIAVSATSDIQDPINVMVGEKGVHSKTVIRELGLKFIDLVRWESDPGKLLDTILRGSYRSEMFKPKLQFDPVNHRVTATVDKETHKRFTANNRLHLRLVSELVGWDIILVCQDKANNV
jgi:transcription antitermination factor NusA-like protein